MSRRQAALMLHGMSESDRLWMLEQLGPAKQAELEPLLAELVELGIPGDPSLLEDVLRVQARAVDREMTPLERVDRMSAQDVCALLQEEPTSFVALLLKARNWRWGEEVAQRLGIAWTAGPAADGLSEQAARLMLEKAQHSSAISPVLEHPPVGGTWERVLAKAKRYVQPLQGLRGSET